MSKSDAEQLGLKNYNEANGALNSNYAIVNVGEKEFVSSSEQVNKKY